MKINDEWLQLDPEIFVKDIEGKNFKIEGVRKETYYAGDDENNELLEGDNPIISKYFICCNSDNQKYEIEIYENYGECESGYTSAKWGKMHIHKVDEYGPMTHVPKNDDLSFEFNPNSSGFKCDIFMVDYDGSDYLYPEGYILLDLDYFIDIQRKEIDISTMNLDELDLCSESLDKDIITLENRINELEEKKRREKLKSVQKKMERKAELIKKYNEYMNLDTGKKTKRGREELDTTNSTNDEVTM